MLYEIYLITNLINNKKYVGQTKKGRSERRWQEHSVFYVNDNKILHNAIIKHGIENFEFKLIETDVAESRIDELEKHYIKYYNTFYLNGYGYNMTEGGQGVHGYTHTEETKQRIKESNLATWQRIREEEPERYAQLCLNRSLALKGRPKSTEHRAKLSEAASKRTGEKNPFFGKQVSKKTKEKVREIKVKNANFNPVNAYELHTGKLWKTFNFISEAVQELNLNEAAKTRIWVVCTEQKGHAYGYIWRYKANLDLAELPIELLRHEHKTPRARAVCQYDLENNFIAEFESAAAASRFLEPDIAKQRRVAKKINTVCVGKANTYHKFIWKYKD